MGRLNLSLSVYGNRKMAALAGLGLASGLPYVLAGDTLAAWLSSVKIDVQTIGLFSLISLPYVLKFLWAPILDRYMPPGLWWLGRRRSWLAVTQILLALCLAGLALAGGDPSEHLVLIAIVGTAIVMLSASQDIAADAYRTDVLGERELGAGVAVFVSGYRIAMILGGAGALIIAQHLGWQVAYAIMAILMMVAIIITLRAPEPPMARGSPHSLREAVTQPLMQFLRRGTGPAILLLVFVIVFRMPDYLAQRMTMPLLLQHLEFTPQQVGWVRQMFGFALTILGALVGGGIIARRGLMQSLIIFGILQTLSNAGFLLLANLPANLTLMGAVIGIESFCGGLVATGFVAFLMSCCDQRYSATQFAMLSAAMALANSLGGSITGVLVARLGYSEFFLMTILAGIPGLLMLPWLRRGAAAQPSLPQPELAEAAV